MTKEQRDRLLRVINDAFDMYRPPTNDWGEGLTQIQHASEMLLSIENLLRECKRDEVREFIKNATPGRKATP